MNRWRRASARAATIVAAALLALLFLRSRSRVTGDQVAASSLIASAHDEVTPIASPPPIHVPRVTSAEEGGSRQPGPPVIDEIIVEKPSVCEGEENLVKVRAHTPDGSNDFLRYVIAGHRGQSVPVKVYRRPLGDLARPAVMVFARDGVATTVAMPAYEVRDCRKEISIGIRYGALANTLATFQFAAMLSQAAADGKMFAPVGYEWDFGDGSVVRTPSRFAVHDYSNRTQTALFTYYLVKVRAMDDSGLGVEGRESIEFFNSEYHDLKKFGKIVIVGEGRPRFPFIDERGLVRQSFQLRHYYPESVTIRNIEVLRVDEAGNRLASDGGLEVTSSLTTHTLDRGASANVDVAFDATRFPEVPAVVLVFHGEAEDGTPAEGEVTLMKPPPVPTRENSIPVRDPDKANRIRAAMRILGKQSVSLEDIAQLEREGLLPPPKGSR